jgi:hypothetical protein
MSEHEREEKKRRGLQVVATIEVPEAQDEEEIARKRRQECREKAGLWINSGIAIFTALAAGAAIRVMWLTGDAVTAAVEANKLTREQFAASVRPRIVLKEFAVMRGHSEGDPAVFVVTVANVGEGPAVDVHVTRKSSTYVRPMPAGIPQTVPKPMDDWPPGKNGSFKRSVLPKRGRTSSLSFTIDSPHLNDPRQRGNLGAAGPWRFLVSGRITYQSEAQADRTLTLCYCMVWKPKWGQIVPGKFGETTPADLTLPEEPERASYDECSTNPEDGCGE